MIIGTRALKIFLSSMTPREAIIMAGLLPIYGIIVAVLLNGEVGKDGLTPKAGY
jgi:hypothetical protein